MASEWGRSVQCVAGLKTSLQFSGLICRSSVDGSVEMAVCRQYGQLPANGPWPGRERAHSTVQCSMKQFGRKERRWAADYHSCWLIYSYSCSCTFSHLIMNPCPTQSFFFSQSTTEFSSVRLAWAPTGALVHVLTHSFTHYCWQSVLAASTAKQQCPWHSILFKGLILLVPIESVNFSLSH